MSFITELICKCIFTDIHMINIYRLNWALVWMFSFLPSFFPSLLNYCNIFKDILNNTQTFFWWFLFCSKFQRADIMSPHHHTYTTNVNLKSNLNHTVKCKCKSGPEKHIHLSKPVHCDWKHGCHSKKKKISYANFANAAKLRQSYNSSLSVYWEVDGWKFL